MHRLIHNLGRVLLVVVPLGLGIALVASAISQREPLAQSEPEAPPLPVRVVTLEASAPVPRVTAHGSVQPSATWRGVAQVAGEVAWLHPGLQPGHLVEAGETLVRLDPTDYELAEAKAEAQLASAEASRRELELREQNLETSLAIERRALELAQTELERRRTLHERQTASQAAVDQAEEALLQRRQRVQEIENQLSLIPAQRRIQDAARAVAEAQLVEARRSIARTVIRMPFDGRIAEVDVEREQFVSAGQVMAVAEDIAKAEVSARLRLDQLEALIGERTDFRSVAELSASEIDAVALGLGIEAELRLPLADRVVAWPARLDRVSFALEPQTRTIGIVVAVDDPFRQAVLGERPPLVKDMFVEVVLKGSPRYGALVVPREALRRDEDGGWTVHLANDQDRLERRQVRIGYNFGNIVVVREGLVPGDRVVLSEIPVGVEGMQLAPVPDEAAAARIAAGDEAP